VCKQLSANQVTNPGIIDFVNSLIQYGFEPGKRLSATEPEEHSISLKLSISDLRIYIING
jgi:hypothetical protein